MELAHTLADAVESMGRSSPELRALSSSLLTVDLVGEERRSYEAAGTIPALRHLPWVIEWADSNLFDRLLRAAQGCLGAAAWTTYYAPSDWSSGFLDEFATGVLVGPSGPWYSRQVSLGLFLQGPHTVYPSHAHPAAEVYRLLAGSAEFAVGADGFVEKRPGDWSLHASNEAHAIRTQDTPMFAVYAWRGDLKGPTWYREDMSNPDSPKLYPTMAW
jgi:hypothetical protein